MFLRSLDGGALTTAANKPRRSCLRCRWTPETGDVTDGSWQNSLINGAGPDRLDRSDQPDTPGEARGLSRSRRDSEGANRATARGRDELRREGLLQLQRPSPCSRLAPRSAGRKRNRRCRCNRFGRRIHHHGCRNPVPQSRPDQWTQPRAKAMLLTRHGRPSEHGKDLTLKRQVPAAAPASASGPVANDTEPFCTAMPLLATCDSLPCPTDLLRFSM